jgi:putative DNA primase/helicase
MSETTVTHDGSLCISTGRDRFETRWKQQDIQWSALVEKLSKTIKTRETHAEYMLLDKGRQDNVKDVGGFVGGVVNKGNRKKENIGARQLITLDLDTATGYFWEDFCMLYDNAALIYSTHKHTPAEPRYRLILPLSREVHSDEYQAIARKLAEALGMGYFDPTTFQPERLMYWPSTPKDIDYYYQFQDGGWLDADAMLRMYHDWRDMSQWPRHPKENEIVARLSKKQGDPLEKKGMLGVFCRSYTISDVLAVFLADDYESCADPGRYTYRHGSTAGGLVLYEDKYAFSHHSTDPASNKLCNAFDLVRLHKFGHEDEHVKPETPVNKYPSYSSMLQFAASDATVKQRANIERLTEAGYDFNDDSEDTDPEWLKLLDMNEKDNTPKSTIKNVLTILNNDPKIKGCLAFNVFEQREVALKDLPWRKVDLNSPWLTDKDDAAMREHLESKHKITTVSKINDGVAILMMNNSFHPVRDYLSSVKWDGVKRVDRLLIDYLGAEDTLYTRTVTRKTFVGAVARIFQPGVKFDHVLTLVGVQGHGKSWLIGKLGKQWFSDSMGSLRSKEAFENLQGVWLMEIGELSQFKNQDVAIIKHFISKREDRYRVAYGKRVENFPRQSVMFGTTNDFEFLQDDTGDRRFWPIDCTYGTPTKNIFTEFTNKEVDLFWAEVLHYYQKGETIYLDKEMDALAAEVQERHSVKDDRAPAIYHYLNTLLPPEKEWFKMSKWDRQEYLKAPAPKGRLITEVMVDEIWKDVFNKSEADMSTGNTKFIHAIMRRHRGWRIIKTRNDKGNVSRGYERLGDHELQLDIIQKQVTEKMLTDSSDPTDNDL